VSAQSATPQAEVKSHRQQVTQTPGEYVVHMGGTMDGINTRGPVGYRVFDQAYEPNVELSITNVGNEVVRNPWIKVDERGGWRTIEEMVAEFTAGLKTDADKARAAYEFQRKHRHHCSTYDNENRDVVKMMNCYGYTLCFDDSKCLAQLWEAAGLKTRRGWPYGHSVTEVFYDDAWHMLDGDEHCIFLLRDNKTIASEEQFVRDPDLIKRTHTYGPLFKDDRMTDQGGAGLFYYDGPRGGGWLQKCRHRMDFDLRPGEKIAWRWDNRGRYHGVADIQQWKGALEKVCNGYIEYETDLKEDRGRKGIVVGSLDLSTGTRQVVTIPVKTAWPIVGGWVEVTCNGSARLQEVQLVRAGMSQARTIWTSDGKEVGQTVRVSLDEEFAPASAACYEYKLAAIAGRQKCQGECPVQPDPVKSIRLHSTLQMAWLAMPALACGDNKVVYTDQSNSRKVMIEHKWTERSDSAPPAAPPAARYPRNGATVAGTQFKFQWEPPTGAEPVQDYWFELSEHADMRWVLSPNFQRLISYTPQKGTASFEIPYEGLLNPGQTYYWRVRAQNAAGVWGPWSEAWSFRVKAPGVPLDVRLDWDKEHRALTLSWKPNPQGEKPARYIVYSSDEKGFTASNEPYMVNCGLSRNRLFPANRIGHTTQTSYVIRMLDQPLFINGRAANAASSQPVPPADRAMQPAPVRMFYRVVAEAADGTRSGASDYAQAPGPIIYTPGPQKIPAGETTLLQMRALASLGNLRSRAVDGKSYQADFGLNADELRWSAHSDMHVSIEPTTGLLKLNPAVWDCSEPAEIIILCRNQRGEEDAYRFSVEVVRADKGE